MTKRVKFEIIILACLCGLLLGSKVDIFKKDIALNLPLESVVQVKVVGTEIDWYTGEFAKWEGSGVFIRDNLILTAGHIVGMAKEIEIIEADGDKYKAVNWYKEFDADIGFIVVDTNDIEKKLKFDNAILGENAWACGNPYGVFPVLTKGIISAVMMPDNYTDTKHMLITDAGANLGNSGCPLFNKKGRILGICSWHYPYAEGMNYFVRAEIIQLSLNKYKAMRALKEAK